MGDREMWKMSHLLFAFGRPELTGAELQAAGIRCYMDTIQILVQDGVVVRDGDDFQLSPAAARLVGTCVLANADRPGTDIVVDHPSAFVVMPFSQPWSDAVYQQMIEPAVLAAGLECHRGDTIVRVGDLTSNIWRQLLRTGLVIADVSAPNVNVFYELGLTHALGKDCLLLKEARAALPADFGGAHYHEYRLDALEAGRDELRDAIEKWKTDRSVEGVRALAR